MPVKVFGPSASKVIEQQVNDWMSEVSPNITRMTQSQDNFDQLILTILYEKPRIKNLTESTGPR